VKEKQVKETASTDVKFVEATTALFSNPDAKVWLRLAKEKYRYYFAATVLGKGTENGAAFHDGQKQIIRDVDKILEG
jgi:hypothetical protein